MADMQPWMLQLRLGYVTISTIGSPNDSHHPNVLRLSIIRSSLGSFVCSILSYLPRFFTTFAQCVAPNYFLPSSIIVKKL